MSVKFTCDWCDKEIHGEYCCYEGWRCPVTMEWWEEGKDWQKSYHVNTFCSREYDRETGRWVEESCQARFLLKNRIVLEPADRGPHNWKYLQKDLEESDLVYDKRGFYTQVKID